MSRELINLSEIDLDDLPQRKAVYGMFAQDKNLGKPIISTVGMLEKRTILKKE